MATFRFILICCTLVASTYAMADRVWARRTPAVERHEQPAPVRQLIQDILTAPTPESAKAAGERLRPEYDAATRDPDRFFRSL